MINRSVLELSPYVPGKPVSELAREYGLEEAGIVKLASNENPLGLSLHAREAIEANITELARYPDGSGYVLRQVLSHRHAIAPQRITLGNGSNDVLDMIAAVVLNPQVSTVFSEHAFAVYPISSMIRGAKTIAVPARDYAHDLEAMLAAVDATTRLVWIANPNNPTGTWLGRDALYAFLQQIPTHVWVVVDEAYTEYASLHADYPDASLWLDEFPNLIVTRTFSKAWGLAGLRIGYALSSASMADSLNRVRQPFNVNLLALAAAEAVLEDAEYLARGLELNQAGIGMLTGFFDRLSFKYIPSAGNFLTFISPVNVAELNERLLRQGVIVRPVENYGIAGGMRVSIGLEEENRRFMEVLEEEVSSWD
jgi:histidinol-phosphate aminotransferase